MGISLSRLTHCLNPPAPSHRLGVSTMKSLLLRTEVRENVFHSMCMDSLADTKIQQQINILIQSPFFCLSATSLNWLLMNSWNLHLHYLYIYIYIYGHIYVCVCVCERVSGANPLTPFHVCCQFQFLSLLCGNSLRIPSVASANDCELEAPFSATAKMLHKRTIWSPAVTEPSKDWEQASSGSMYINHDSRGAFNVPLALSGTWTETRWHT